MGYRLHVSRIEDNVFCGGKLYGYGDYEYNDDGNDGYIEKKTKSHQWLVEKGYLKGDEFWTYGFNPKIILNSREFKEFIELYNEDCNNFKEEYIIHPKDWIINDERVQKLINGKDDVLLEWY